MGPLHTGIRKKAKKLRRRRSWIMASYRDTIEEAHQYGNHLINGLNLMGWVDYQLRRKADDTTIQVKAW